MGSALASRLLQGGFGITGWDIDSSRCAVLSKIGGKAAVDAAEVVNGSPRVILSLPDHEVVTDVLHGVNASFRRRQMIIDTSTGDPDQAADLGRQLDDQGPPVQDPGHRLHHQPAAAMGAGVRPAAPRLSGPAARAEQPLRNN